MKNLLNYLVICSMVFVCEAKAVSVLVHNKSTTCIAVTLTSGQITSDAKTALKPRQSKKFTLPALTEQQSAQLTIEREGAYWSQRFELKKMAPGQLVLKRDSLVVSSKYAKKSDICTGQIKIGYFDAPAAPGKQEIMFIK